MKYHPAFVLQNSVVYSEEKIPWFSPLSPKDLDENVRCAMPVQFP